jgi:hypothetical protein
MKKLILPFLLLIALSAIWGFQWKDRNKKVRYRLEITSLNDTETSFEATVRLGGESIRLSDQKTPFTTTIEASDLEYLIHASNPVRIILASKDGKLESELKTAYIEADGMKKRIMGM